MDKLDKLDKLDLNIENYELEDILNLFKIPSNINMTHLKEAKKMVLKTHPDKSGLHPDYFRFFSKAYKVVYEIWEFKNKHDKELTNIEYKTHVEDFTVMDKSKKKMLDGYFKKEKLTEPDDFNKWFNKQFEKNKTESEEDTHGYGNWLKSDSDLPEQSNISFSQMEREFELKKQSLRSLIVYKGVDESQYYNMGGSNLSGDIPDNFTSGLFSSLQYEDLRKAHTETVIPVTMEDYKSVKKFNDVNEYTAYRNNQNMVPLSEVQSREYLSNKERLEEKESTERAYKLAKQLEETQKKQKTYWASILHIN